MAPPNYSILQCAIYGYTYFKSIFDNPSNPDAAAVAANAAADKAPELLAIYQNSGPLDEISSIIFSAVVSIIKPISIANANLLINSNAKVDAAIGAAIGAAVGSAIKNGQISFGGDAYSPDTSVAVIATIYKISRLYDVGSNAIRELQDKLRERLIQATFTNNYVNQYQLTTLSNEKYKLVTLSLYAQRASLLYYNIYTNYIQKEALQTTKFKKQTSITATVAVGSGTTLTLLLASLLVKNKPNKNTKRDLVISSSVIAGATTAVSLALNIFL
jgi:hypothetical protein